MPERSKKAYLQERIHEARDRSRSGLYVLFFGVIVIIVGYFLNVLLEETRRHPGIWLITMGGTILVVADVVWLGYYDHQKNRNNIP